MIFEIAFLITPGDAAPGAFADLFPPTESVFPDLLPTDFFGVLFAAATDLVPLFYQVAYAACPFSSIKTDFRSTVFVAEAEAKSFFLIATTDFKSTFF